MSEKTNTVSIPCAIDREVIDILRETKAKEGIPISFQVNQALRERYADKLKDEEEGKKA